MAPAAPQKNKTPARTRPISDDWRAYLTDTTLDPASGFVTTLASAAGNGEAGDLLADFPADMQIPPEVWTAAGPDGRTPLHTAANSGLLSDLSNLYEKGFGPPPEAFALADKRGGTFWHEAARTGHLDEAFPLADKAGAKAEKETLLSPTVQGHTPVHWAAWNGQGREIANRGITFSCKDVTREVRSASAGRGGRATVLSILVQNLRAGGLKPLLDPKEHIPWPTIKAAAWENGEPSATPALYGKGGKPFEDFAALGAFRRLPELEEYMKGMPDEARTEFEGSRKRVKTYSALHNRLKRREAGMRATPLNHSRGARE